MSTANSARLPLPEPAWVDPATLTPPQLRQQQRTWREYKDDRRAVAAYRNSLPQGIARLDTMLADAPSPWHAAVIRARIDQVRDQNREKNRRRRAAADQEAS